MPLVLKAKLKVASSKVTVLVTHAHLSDSSGVDSASLEEFGAKIHAHTDGNPPTGASTTGRAQCSAFPGIWAGA